MTIGVQDQFQPTRDAQFGEDRGNVMADRVVADEETIANVTILESLNDQVEHFALAIAERSHLFLIGIGIAGHRGCSKVGEHVSHGHTVKPHLARMNLVNGLEQDVRRLILEENSNRTAPNGVAVGVWVAHTGKDKHLRLCCDGLQVGQNFQAVLARHIEIEQYDVGLRGRRHIQGSRELVGFAYDPQSWILLNQHPKSSPNHHVVIDNHDPNGRSELITHWSRSASSWIESSGGLSKSAS
jgi:hypothetical protein